MATTLGYEKREISHTYLETASVFKTSQLKFSVYNYKINERLLDLKTTSLHFEILLIHLRSMNAFRTLKRHWYARVKLLGCLSFLVANKWVRNARMWKNVLICTVCVINYLWSVYSRTEPFVFTSRRVNWQSSAVNRKVFLELHKEKLLAIARNSSLQDILSKRDLLGLRLVF